MAHFEFSWSDSIQAAFASCLPCLQPHHDEQHDDNDSDVHNRGRNVLNYSIPPPRARSDELEGLLVDTDSADAETLSLHSNLGDERRRRRRRKPRKGVRFFGFDLFGRQPIELPESDEEDGRRTHRSRTLSTSSTLDSDAAPLDPAAIAQLSAAQLAEAAARVEEERKKAKEERKKLRRERRELKKARLAMAMDLYQGDEDFEGFQGSGAAPYSFSPGPGTASGSGTLSVTDEGFTEDFGPFNQAVVSPHVGEEDNDADFGAETYTRPNSNHTMSAGASDSRGSRTSGSISVANSHVTDAAYYNHHYVSQQPQAPGTPNSSVAFPRENRKKKRSSRAQSIASHSTQSTSLRSPPPGQLSIPSGGIPARENGEIAHSTRQSMPSQELSQKSTPVTPSEGSFPSVGLRGVQRTKSDMGVFLARRGE
ncbi:hypothetical protein CERSUDRAFT_116801 [Gelatoporia subvermispora B]|uniref:Uncharacterized protein n=1 Tax=Ceriporiopsis subvermispora (strain B) TaxID=914234 RepID=M2R867_CERS8|nr:hypothetical protein CERSUDRAFT_116801 [Gelatoporia subvermispora B]